MRKMRPKEIIVPASSSSFSSVALPAGLVNQTREAIALNDLQQTGVPDADPLHEIEADFLAAESTGRLARAVRQTVQANRGKPNEAA